MSALVLALSSISASSAPGGADTPSGDTGAHRLTAPSVTGAVYISKTGPAEDVGGDDVFVSISEGVSNWVRPQSSTRGAGESGRPGQYLSTRVTHLRRGVQKRRSATWQHQDAIDRPRTKTAYAERRTRSVPFLGWIRSLWAGRAHKAWQLKVRLETDAETAIRFVFGPYADQAIAVARCESGLSRHAHNGQYLGLFQMGTSERATYGHGDTFLEQARAAHRYFVASGRDWSPWQCRPWGLGW